MDIKFRRSVLALTPKSLNREKLRKSLAVGNYQISFISSITEINAAIVTLKPDVFVHDWQTLDESQSRKFHYHAMRIEVFESIPRVVILAEVTPGMLAFASDVLVDRVFTYSSAYLTLPNELDMILQSQRNGIEIKNLIRELRNHGSCYTQEQVDEKVVSAYKFYPHDPNVQIEYGNYQLRQDEVDEARHLAIDVIRKCPLNLRAANLLSRAYMKQGFWDQAMDVLRKSDGLSPSNPERILLMADVYYGKGDFDKALFLYEQVKELDQELRAAANKGIGQIKLAQGQLEDALALLTQSVSEEEVAGYFNNSAVFSVKQGDLDQALKLYQAALKGLRTDRLKPTIFNNIALTYRRMGLYEEAEKYLKKTLRIDGKNTKALQQIRAIARGGKK